MRTITTIIITIVARRHSSMLIIVLTTIVIVIMIVMLIMVMMTTITTIFITSIIIMIQTMINIWIVTLPMTSKRCKETAQLHADQEDQTSFGKRSAVWRYPLPVFLRKPGDGTVEGQGRGNGSITG